MFLESSLCLQMWGVEDEEAVYAIQLARQQLEYERCRYYAPCIILTYRASLFRRPGHKRALFSVPLPGFHLVTICQPLQRFHF